MIGATYDAAFGVETLSTMVKTFDTQAYDKFFSDLYRKSTITTIKPGVATYAKSLSWADKATPILSGELEEFVAGKGGYVAQAGRFPGLALINNSVEGYLIANTEVQSWLKYNFGGSVGFSNPASTEVMGGMAVGGLKWLKNVHGYVPSGKTTFTKFMPDGTVILLPPEEELGEILAMAEGYGIVPRNAFGSENANGVVDLAPSPGFYSYATAIENPAGVRIYVGWLGLPVIKFPKAVNVGMVL